ncbi:Ig-like domain-containing protein [Brevibacillus centrosporus]|uniref:Ig-like domain-containing protein n=1 Tax=Brevibacillus centrosporus TaxID=54910 RepID=UPI002E1FF3FF|nr:Ig-like domain-containing protein [Brevibacillus centrosporus]
MNKKVALSVLSATVFASMAASAFAAPKSGLYIGGNVDKYYSMNTLLGGMSSSALDQFSTEIGSAGFSNLIYVDFDGKGASIAEIMSATDFESAKKDLTADKFEGVYSNIKADGSADGTYDPRNDAIDTPAGDLKVESVSAINAKQIEIKFSTEIDADTVIDSTKGNGLIGNAIAIVPTGSNTNAITIDPAGDNSGGAQASGEFSADGKTLTITAPGTDVFEGSYSVTFADKAVDDVNGNELAEEVKLFSATDTTRPTADASVSYTDNKTAVIGFSEPMQSKGTVSYKFADGTSLPAVGEDGLTAPISEAITADGLEINLSNLNVAARNKDIVVTVIGATDFADLIVSPNPLTKTIKYSTADATAPTVASITALSNTTAEVKFSEELSGNPTITIGGTAATVTQSSTDKTKYTATVPAVSGLQTVAVSAFTDKSGNAGTAFSKVVNFTVDGTDPVVASSKVEKINGVEYLVVTFNENVNTTNGGTIALSYVKDFVSKTTSIVVDNAGVGQNFYQHNLVSGKSSSVRIDLSSLTDSATYTATLPAGLVTDLNGNLSEEKEITFVRNSDSVSTKPEVLKTAVGTGGNGIEVPTSNTVKVHFASKIDGASATNKANYTIEGATVAKAELLSNDAVGGYVVQLTLAEGSSTFDGLRTVTVSGVKSETGVAMDPYTTSESLLENVRPTITKAELTDITTGTSTEITLTFSEAMDPATIEDATDAAADFKVFIGGSEFAGTIVEAGAGNTFTLTLNAELTAAQLTSGVVVKPATGIDAADVNGNKVNFTSVTVAQ